MKLGLIGAGNRLTHLVQKVFRTLEPNLQVVGVVDPDEAGVRARLEGLGEPQFFSSLPELVRKTKPDALAIGTRCNLHTPFAIEAARTGLPLFLEKPVAISFDQAEELEKAFASSASKVVVSFPLRTSPLCNEVLRMLQKGAVGNVEHLLAVNYVPYGSVYFAEWYRDYSVTQGLFLQKATHDFDYLSYLAGAPISQVAAMTSQGRVFRDRKFQTPGTDDQSCAYYEGIGTPETGMNEDSSSALLEFANGVKGVYTQVFYARGKSEARGATISGYRGTVSFDWYRNEIRHVPHPEGEEKVIRSSEGESHFGGDQILGRNFLDVVHGRERSITPIEVGLASVYACLAAKESAERGAFVRVRQVSLQTK